MLQFMVEELEDLTVTLLEELRERPAVVAAIAAGVVGALVGTWVAQRTRPRRRRSVTQQLAAELVGPLASALGRSRVADTVSERTSTGLHLLGARANGSARAARRAGSAVDLVQLVLRLLQNPLVRAYLASLIARQLRRA
jgi:uncharacterized membrane protein YeaQ/YmgE (transglycosylase-associated protein family)